MRKDKSVEVLAKVFHHVITLGLAMYQHIQSQTFLLNNGLPDMFRNARAVVVGVEITLFEIQTQGTNFRGLREGTNRGGRPRWQFKTRTLGFSTHFIDIRTLAVLGGDRRQTLFYRRIMYAGRVTTCLNRGAPLCQSCRVTTVQRIAQQCQFMAFL